MWRMRKPTLFAVVLVVVICIVGVVHAQDSKPDASTSTITEVLLSPTEQLEIEKQALLIEVAELKLAAAERAFKDARDNATIALNRIYIAHQLNPNEYAFDQFNKSGMRFRKVK